MDFRILGPLEVRAQGSLIALGGKKQRALLAILLIRANQVVSVDRLIDELWGDLPPDTAQNVIQVYVSQLRKALEGSDPRGKRGEHRVLRTWGPGYVLEADELSLDVARFESLAAQGRQAFHSGDPRRAADRLRQALGQWRGPALADFAFEPFAQVDAERLEELRIATIEQRMQAELELGYHRELVGELESLVAEHPLREELRSQLMLALYRSGRQPDALQVYRETRETLAEELGIEPTPGLQGLHQAILRQDPALAPPRATEMAVTISGPPVLTDTPVEAPVPFPSRRFVTVVAVTLQLTEQASLSAHRDAVDEALLEQAGSAILRHGGRVDRSLSESFLLGFFGVPRAREDDALRAVRAASEIRDSVRSSGTGAHASARIGVATGKVVAEGTTLPKGEPIHVAIRLAQRAPAGEIVIAITTRGLLHRTVVVDHAPVREGLRLLGLTAGPTQESTLFVDREAELRNLQQAYEQVEERRSPHLFTMLGTPGVGKSRLAREFTGTLLEPRSVLEGRCLPYGEGITYWPVAEMIRSAAAIKEGDSRRKAIQKLASRLTKDPESQRITTILAQVVGLTDSASSPQETFWAIKRFLDVMARGGPLVVLVDDLHWGEPPLLDLLDYVVDRSHAPLLIMCLARPDLLDRSPNWGAGKLNSTSVLLEPLHDEAQEALVQDLLGGTPDALTRRTIAQAAGGNPLFLEEILSFMLEEGHLREANGIWTAADRSELPLPPTLDAILVARIERLSPSERTAIEAAAVAGKEFSSRAVADLAGRDIGVGADEALDSLERKQLIRAAMRESITEDYAFRHILIRDAAYSTIPPDRLARLHEAFGNWLKVDSDERVSEYDEIIGYHLELALRLRQQLGETARQLEDIANEAGRSLASAGRRALARGDVGAAVTFLSRATGLLPPVSRAPLMPELAYAQREAGDLGGAAATLTHASRLADEAKDEGLAAQTRMDRSFVDLMIGAVSMKECLHQAQRAAEVFGRLGDQQGLARAWHDIGRTLLWMGRCEAAEEALERSIQHARAVADQRLVSESLMWLSPAIALGPKPIPEVIARIEGIRNSHGAPSVQAEALLELASAKAQQGRFDEAREDLSRSDSLLAELGAVVLRAALHPIAEVELLANDPEAAVARLAPRADELRRMGEKTYLSTSVAWLAQANYELGRYEEALDLTRESEETAAPDDVESQIRWQGVRAKILATRAFHKEAQALAQQSVRIAEATDSLNWQGHAFMELGEVLSIEGRRAEAADVIDRARLLFDRKGNFVMADRAAGRLSELGTAAGRSL